MRPCPDVTSCNQIQFSRCHDEKLMSARGLLYSFQNFNNFNPFTEALYVGFYIDHSICEVKDTNHQTTATYIVTTNTILRNNLVRSDTEDRGLKPQTLIIDFTQDQLQLFNYSDT